MTNTYSPLMLSQHLLIASCSLALPGPVPARSYCRPLLQAMVPHSPLQQPKGEQIATDMWQLLCHVVKHGNQLGVVSIEQHSTPTTSTHWARSSRISHVEAKRTARTPSAVCPGVRPKRTKRWPSVDTVSVLGAPSETRRQ